MPTPATTDELLQRFLAERDFECPGCRYNLRNLQSSQCPECGEELELTLRMVEPRQGALIAGLVGLSAGLGFWGLAMTLGLIMTLVFASPGPSRFFLVTGGGCAVHGLALWLWLRHWQRLRRMAATWRRVLVLVCWGLAMAEVVVLAACAK